MARPRRPTKEPPPGQPEAQPFPPRQTEAQLIPTPPPGQANAQPPPTARQPFLEVGQALAQPFFSLPRSKSRPPRRGKPQRAPSRQGQPRRSPSLPYENYPNYTNLDNPSPPKESRPGQAKAQPRPSPQPKKGGNPQKTEDFRPIACTRTRARTEMDCSTGV